MTRDPYRQHIIRKPDDFLGLRKKVLRLMLAGSLLVGTVPLNLYYKQEQLQPGVQRQITYVNHGKRKQPEVILSVTVFLTSGGSINRDGSLPGWNPGNNTIDCIGGGGGSASTVGNPSGGGGGGGLARYGNHPALPATISYSVGAGGTPGVAGGNTSFNGTVGAYGGGAGTSGGGNGPGGAGGTYFAGTGYYAGGAGGIGVATAGGGGGGGGAAGYYGGGGGGANSSLVYGAPGGAGGAGNGGGGGAGAGAPGNGGAGGNGGEYGGAGSGGGGGGAYGDGQARYGGNGGAYGGGAGGCGFIKGAPGGGSYGYQGLIIIMYTPLTAPVVSSISPNAGSTAGGQAVAISGSGFVNVTSVNIGGAPLTGLSYNANAIYGTTTAGAAGTYNVNVNVSGGVAAGVGYNLYTYVAAPTLSSCTPNKGPDIGGTPVTIIGTGFGGVSGVTFGGTPATSIVVVNATTITCVTPAHAFGLVNVSISGAYGTADLIGGFNYLPPSGGFNMPMMGI
jgi:hypothetical protein